MKVCIIAQRTRSTHGIMYVINIEKKLLMYSDQSPYLASGRNLTLIRSKPALGRRMNDISSQPLESVVEISRYSQRLSRSQNTG